MRPINAYLVCGGKYHDFDFARLELLKLLAERPEIRTRVAGDYRDREGIATADLLIAYTCDLRPSPEEQDTLARFVGSGRRWFALHGTNSVMEERDGVPFYCPRSHPTLMRTLGSQFLAHPPLGRFRVGISKPDHPLVTGLEAFEVEDELYLCEYHPPVEPLLEARFVGTLPDFDEGSWPKDEPRLVMYLRPVGAGHVLYLTLGHCRGRYDMRPRIAEYPRIERGPWGLPVFTTLLRRGIQWASGDGDPIRRIGGP
jgi:type 1 glutamine amidotransferase